eukprot:350715-Chlamydomonas_euryale.AAC.10
MRWSSARHQKIRFDAAHKRMLPAIRVDGALQYANTESAARRFASVPALSGAAAYKSAGCLQHV